MGVGEGGTGSMMEEGFIGGQTPGSGLAFGGSMGGDAYDEWVESGEQAQADLMDQGVFTLPDGSGYVISNAQNIYGSEILEQAGMGTGQVIFDNPENALETIAYLQNLLQLHEQGFYDDPLEGLTGGYDFGNSSFGFGGGGFDFTPTGFGPTDWSNIDWSNIDFNAFSPGASNMRNQMFSGGAGISAGINSGSAGRRLDYASGGGGASTGFAGQGKNIETPLDSLIRKYSSVGETI